MKAEIINLLHPTLKPQVKVWHGDEVLDFQMSGIGKDALKDKDVFVQLNQFWDTLSVSDQEHVFSIYKHIYTLLRTNFEMLVHMRELNRYVVELLNFHEYERMRHWIVFISDIVIPSNFSEDYKTAENKNTSRERTYTRGEYVGLVTLALIFRTMIPVWGEFIAGTRKETGTSFKEYYAFQLCSRSNVLHTEPYEKLRLYVDLAIGDDNQNKDNIIDGISSEDFSNWMLAGIAIRRLCVGDISGVGGDPEANLVTSVWKYVTQKIKPDDGKGDNSIKNKEYDDDGASPEDKLSVLERYKNKHNISIGDITVLEYSVTNLPALAFRLSQNMTPELLERSLASVQMLNPVPIRDPQITLLRWVMKPVISPQGILYLSKPSIVNLMGVMQAVLLARGYPFLALLSTCYADVSQEELRVSNMDSRAHLSKERRARLDELYPYLKHSGRGRDAKKGKINMAVHSIDMVVENLSMYSWKLTADRELSESIVGTNPSGRLSVPYDIRNNLADLVIEIGSHTWK
ncbi:MAG: hypothetical protein ACR2HF_08980 [Methylococcaceae bacterium]